MIIAALLLTMAVALDGAEDYNRVSLYYSYLHWSTDLSKGAGDDGALDLQIDTPEKQKVNQGVLGLNATGVLSERFHLDLGGTLANTSARLEYNNSANDYKHSLSSLNDTHLRLTYTFGDGKGSGSVFLSLPTGKRKLTSEQYALTAELADVSRKFAVRRYGQGLDVGIDWFALPRWDSFDLTIGGGYLYHGKYQPLESDEREYKYGDEIYGVLGFSVKGRQVGGSAGLTIKYYTKDKFDDEDIFQAGVATTISAALTYSEEFDLTLGTSILMRGKAKTRSSQEQVMSDEVLKSGRNQILAYVNGRFPASEKLRVLGRLELENVSANEYTRDDLQFLPKSHYFGLGGGVAYSLSEAFSASSMVSYYTGKIDSDYGLTGLGLMFVLTFQPGQGR